MKTFTANEFRRNPRQVYRAADVEGSVKINHSDYPDKVFIIEGRARGEGVILEESIISSEEVIAAQKEMNGMASMISAGSLVARNKDKIWPIDREPK